jgi:hypothetical protein
VKNKSRKLKATFEVAFNFLVEMGGIGHPGQPVRLHAQCHSQARCMQLETPAHPALF